MILTELLFNILAISGFTLGLGIASMYEIGDPKYKQMALYWLRKPFDDYRERIEQQEEKHNEIARKEKENAYTRLAKVKEDTHLMAIRIENEYNETREKNREWREGKLNWLFWFKPIILCVKCMPSFWGSIIFWLINFQYIGMIGWYYFCIYWVICCATSVFINSLLWEHYTKISSCG